MNKQEIIQAFLDDANYDGTYFNNTARVKNTVAVELAKTDNRIKTYKNFGDTFTSYIPEDVQNLIAECCEAAHMELTNRPGYHETLAKRQEQMRATQKSIAAYYEKYGTKGEF